MAKYTARFTYTLETAIEVEAESAGEAQATARTSFADLFSPEELLEVNPNDFRLVSVEQSPE